jgi:aromatic ring-opening dioxygenase LigB subunit
MFFSLCRCSLRFGLRCNADIDVTSNVAVKIHSTLFSCSMPNITLLTTVTATSKIHLQYGCGIPLYLYQSGFVRNLVALLLLRRVVSTIRFSEFYAIDTVNFLTLYTVYKPKNVLIKTQ